MVFFTDRISSRKIALILLFVFGIFFVGRGITGFYLMDFKQPACVEDSECPAENVCCKFYQKDYGVCDLEKNCDAIAFATKEELQATKLASPEHGIAGQKSISALDYHYESPKKQYTNSIFAGIILLLFSLIALYVENRRQQSKEKQSK